MGQEYTTKKTSVCRNKVFGIGISCISAGVFVFYLLG